MVQETTPDPVPLINLLPAPYQIIYAAFLLVLSVPLTFAGAFLTLDRTRQFAPSSLATVSIEKKGKWRLEGGVGGLLGGYLFGVHLSTLLALAIINEANSATLGPIQFLIIWLLSAITLALLGSRFKYAALPMIGIGGGAAFALFVIVACHPAELARIVLIAVFSVVSCVLCLLPIPNIQHAGLRSAAAWFGAFGIIISISILSGVSEWRNVWARTWVPWDSTWGTSQEKGLTAAFVGLALAGIATDWLLKRQLGECPDEKWDNYLATYASNLPNAHDRPGTFQPELPFWKRLFNPPPKGPIAFPPDKTLLSSRTTLSPPPYRPGKLRVQGKNSGNSFQPLNKRSKGADDSSGSDSSDEEGQANNGRYIPRPWAKRKDTQATSLSGVTLADAISSHSKGKTKGTAVGDLEKGEVVYSDGESVATPSLGGKKKEERDAPGWTPEFLKRHSVKDGESDTDKKDKKLSPPASRSMNDSPPPGAVPMTPSLMRALDRVSQAQNDAYGGIISKGHTPQASMPGATTPGQVLGVGGAGGTPGMSKMNVGMPTPNGYDWGAFWRNVEDKAKEDGPKTTR